MSKFLPTKHVPNSQVRYDRRGNFKWQLEDGIEKWIKRNLGVKE